MKLIMDEHLDLVMIGTNSEIIKTLEREKRDGIRQLKPKLFFQEDDGEGLFIGIDFNDIDKSINEDSELSLLISI